MRNSPSKKRVVAGYLMFLAIVFAISSAIASQPAMAAPGGDACTACHSGEFGEWQDSPHAASGVACENCHGAYKAGHPDQDVMMLSVDPSLCHQCHDETYAQWQGSLHAQNNVTCIGCHVPHEQTTRLASQQLCLSCHDHDVGTTWHQTAHAAAGTHCIDCHLSAPAADSAQPEMAAAGHTFSEVPSQTCIGCHAGNLHRPGNSGAGQVAMTAGQGADNTGQAPDADEPSSAADLTASDSAIALAASDQAPELAASGQVPELTARLQATEQENHSLQTWVLVMLGLGLGAGTALGALAAAVFINVTRSREVPS